MKLVQSGNPVGNRPLGRLRAKRLDKTRSKNNRANGRRSDCIVRQLSLPDTKNKERIFLYYSNK